MYPVLQGGSVPPASNSRMPPLPHEPGFYNDRGATVDIPLDSTKVLVFPLSGNTTCYYIYKLCSVPQREKIILYLALSL